MILQPAPRARGWVSLPWGPDGVEADWQDRPDDRTPTAGASSYRSSGLPSPRRRLAAVAGPHRTDLALAFALDTVEAALGCDLVRAVVAVTDEPLAAAALAGLGALVVA